MNCGLLVFGICEARAKKIQKIQLPEQSQCLDTHGTCPLLLLCLFFFSPLYDELKEEKRMWAQSVGGSAWCAAMENRDGW
jgi:hypothetical protein